MSGFLVVLSSPSGGGKTTVAKSLLTTRSDLAYSVSATTREPRQGERDGVDYHFVSREEFERLREAGQFLEWAEYSGHLYGSLQDEVNRRLAGGRHVLMDIEVKGARQIRQRRQDVVSIFILPPSGAVLLKRLKQRRSETSEVLRRRILKAAEEVEAAGEYDYIVINDDRAKAVTEIAAIVDAESRRTERLNDLHETLDLLRRELARLADDLAPGRSD